MGKNLLSFSDMFKSKEQKSKEDLFKTKNLSKNIEIGDTVMVISLEGNPKGVVYDITGNKLNPNDKDKSYWVELDKFGKMEFSDFDLKVLIKK
jgi:hypothetical protein